MASLLRHSRSVLTQVASAHRTIATANVSTAGTQVRTSGASASLSPTARAPEGTQMAVRDAQKQHLASDAIRPRPAGEPPLVPLVGRALNTWGQIGRGFVFLLSAYFVYTNFITNPEFHKSLKLSREAGNRGSHEQPADRAGTIGQKIDDAGSPKGELNKHL